jgi:hypothetical protein
MYTRSGISRTLALLTLLLFASTAIAGGKNETAVTVWLVIFNNPDACEYAPEPCTEDDIFVGDEANPGNPMYSPAMPDVCYLAGQSVQANGRMSLSGRFAEDTTHGCFFGMGLMDAGVAEIHSVLQRHGWSLESGDGLEDQIGYFEGRCNPNCVDTQFTIHQPTGASTSVSDGYFFPPDMFTPPVMVEGANSMLTREGDGILFSWHTRLAEDD